MKKWLMSSLLAVGFMASAAFASNIATVDASGVVNSTNAAKRAMDILQKKTEEAQAKVDKMEVALTKKQEDLQRKKGVISEDKFLEEQAELRNALRDFRTQAQVIQEGLDRDNMKLRKEITDEVRRVVEELAKEKGYDAVIAQNLLLFSSDSVDITPEVLKRVNARLDK